MTIDIQYKLKSNPVYLKYLRENSNWYKVLNRYPEKFNDFVNDNRVFKESYSLKSNGFDVTIIATHFNKRLPKEENVLGIRVKRFYVGGIKFLPLNLLFFWCTILRYYAKEDIYHCNDLYALPPAFFIKKFINKNARIVYDCHEHETEAQIYNGKPLLKNIAKRIERLMIYSADSVIVVSESIGKDYMKIYNIQEPSLVMNCPIYKSYEKNNYFREKFNIPVNNIILLYVGIFKQGRGLEHLVKIFRKAAKKNNKLSLILLTWGDRIEELRELIHEDTNIYWHDSAPLEKFMDYIASADWGVLLLENISKNNDFALPNKLFDYIMVGLPVITSNLKEISKFVTENKVGYLVNSSNDNEVVSVIKNLDQNVKKKFIPYLEAASKKFTWEQQEKVLLKIYNSL